MHQFRARQVAQGRKKAGRSTAKAVQYLTLSDIRDIKIKTAALPFLKRSAYEDERELRIIYESPTRKDSSLDIAIPLACIERITLSPWIPAVLSDHVKSTIKEIEGCNSMKVYRSTLISNENWKALGESAK
jgi:hypothetical protein